MLTNALHKLSEETSVASIVFFRITFGLLMVWEVTRYFKYGWINFKFIEPGYFFSYQGFSWAQPWSETGMYLHFILLAILAFLIAIGLFYRMSVILFFIGFTYIFLLDKTHYLNHFYLISLISFLLILIPAHSFYSVDSLMFKKIRRKTIPKIYVYLLQFQIAVPYLFGGIAKINADWLKGEPMRSWLPASAEHSNILGDLLTHPMSPWIFSYGGLIFDLLIIPALLWRRTRLIAFFIAVLFHLTNAHLFSIGIFPWFMIAATTLFFKADWCAQLMNRIPPFHHLKLKTHKSESLHLALVFGLALYVIVQVVVPLRHFVIPGNVHWTEEGHRFSWHMKLRSKSAINVFFITDESGKKQRAPLDNYLTKRQQLEMGTQPDMMWQFAQYLKSEYAKKGQANVQITVASFCSLNGRANQPFVKPDFNLAGLSDYVYPAEWIQPLHTELKINSQH